MLNAARTRVSRPSPPTDPGTIAGGCSNPAATCMALDRLLRTNAWLEVDSPHSRQRPFSASRSLRSTPWQVVVEFVAETNFPDAGGRMLVARPDFGRCPQHWRPPGARGRSCSAAMEARPGWLRVCNVRTHALTKGLRPFFNQKRAPPLRENPPRPPPALLDPRRRPPRLARAPHNAEAEGATNHGEAVASLPG